ncbi:polyprenyl synthetase family protein [Gorillibacterium timonense]|uniref:polyprenyl synthetase family protein n=1 Tax=Gorillibacterium timonense TaxID=1689269 RepID=UPI00071D6D36|nr:polyprenyl synthetase family protein [Gorillibacterium timonense]
MKLHEALRIDLTELNEQLIAIAASDPDAKGHSWIGESVARLVEAGGKRLRPMMVLVGARFGLESDPTHVGKAALILEYLHMASLIHDDIIDSSDLRRGEPTLHKAVGIPEAAHIANYMMARAVEWAMEGEIDPAEDDRREQRSDKPRLADVASLLMQLCMGEYQQLGNRFNFDLTLPDYLEKSRNKTAVLMANCFRIGAELNQANKAVCKRLYAFGEALGMAFQIKDDVLDYSETSEQIGKPAGSDLRGGNVTLPVLYALEDKDSELAREIRSLGADSPDEAFARVTRQVAASGAIERSLELSRAYAKKAARIIEKLRPHPATEDLDIFLRYFTE